MICPRCRSEYRDGFTRCADCDVDLVESLSSAASASAPRPTGRLRNFADYCGFLTLEEAREARDRLFRDRVLARISVRETPSGSLDVPVREEYWLRVAVEDLPAAAAALGFDAADDGPVETTDETFRCSECGEDVSFDESFCPNCGARFEDGS